MSAAHTWFGRSIRRPRSRCGNILCPADSGLVHEVRQPLDRLRLTARPSPRSIRDIRREPRKGHAVNGSSI
jgi:hypothetical protein